MSASEGEAQTSLAQGLMLGPARSGRNYGHLPWQIIVAGSIRSMNRMPSNALSGRARGRSRMGPSVGRSR